MNTQATTADHSKIVSASIEGKDVVVAWSNGVNNRIPGIFLRHSPGFPGGKRPAGEAGRFPPTPQALAPSRADVTAEGNLHLTWNPDQLESMHDADWLYDNVRARTIKSTTRGKYVGRREHR